MDLVDYPLTTHTIQMGWDISTKLYPNWRFRWIEGLGVLNVQVYWRFGCIESSGVLTVLVCWRFWCIEGSDRLKVQVYWGFRFVVGPQCRVGNSSAPIRTQTQPDSQWPWLTLAGSKLVAVDLVSLVAENLDLLWAGKKLWIWLCSCNSTILSFPTYILALTTFTYSLSQLSHAWSHRSDILPLTSMTIWYCWEHAGCGGSGFAARGETGFAGSSECRLSGYSQDAVAQASVGATRLGQIWLRMFKWYQIRW